MPFSRGGGGAGLAPMPAQYRVPMGCRAPMLLPHHPAYGPPPSVVHRPPVPAGSRVVLPLLPPASAPPPLAIWAPPAPCAADPRRLAPGASEPAPVSSAPLAKGVDAKLFVCDTSLLPPASAPGDASDVHLPRVSYKGMHHPSRAGLGAVNKFKYDETAMDKFCTQGAGLGNISKEYSLPPDEVPAGKASEKPFNGSVTETEAAPSTNDETPPAVEDKNENSEEQDSADKSGAEETIPVVEPRSEIAEEEAEEKREIKTGRAPTDFCFPTINQTRHYFTSRVEYCRYMAAKGEDVRSGGGRNKNEEYSLPPEEVAAGKASEIKLLTKISHTPSAGQWSLNKIARLDKVRKLSFLHKGLSYVLEAPRIILSAEPTHAYSPMKDSASTTSTVHVYFCDLKIEMAAQIGTKVLDLVYSALQKHKIRASDFYLTLNGRLLDGDVIIEHIHKWDGSTIHVHPRMRGGVIEDYTLSYESLDDFINTNSHRLFRKFFISTDLKLPQFSPRAIPLWSDLTQHIIYNLLMCVCVEGHLDGHCWNGGFSLSDVMVSKYGHVMISSSIAQGPYTPKGGKADYAQLYRIVLILVDLLTGSLPLHVKSFLATLRGTTNAMRCDPDFIVFLINHPVLLSFAERNRLYCLVDQMIRDLPHGERQKVTRLLDAAGARHPGWSTVVTQVPGFNCKYQTGGYGQPLADGFHLGRNFLNHPPQGVSLEMAEVALSYLLSYLLPLVIETLLLRYTGPPEFHLELIRVLSNVRADSSIVPR